MTTTPSVYPFTGEGSKVATPTLSDHDSDKVESPRASKIARHHSPASESLLWSQSGGLPLKRYVEGSDSMVAAPVLQGAESRRSKRNITSESSKEEEKREMMRRAKSPSARIKEKSRAAKTPRLHSPPPEDEGYEYQRSQGSGHADSSQLLSDTEDDMDMTISSEVCLVEWGVVDCASVWCGMCVRCGVVGMCGLSCVVW